MNERSIFMEALERDTSVQRASFLDEACAGDAALRQRVEALLQSHESAGAFMGRPAPERLVQELNNTDNVGETQAETPADDNESDALGFLTPSGKPGVLGRLDHYEILDIVGRGGMGVVLRAFDETLQRIVAIKVMATQLSSSDTARKRFTREAQAAAAVSHDHVVTIHAVEHGPSPYMVMQYVPGVSLQQRLDREGPLPLEEILCIGMQTASGLAAAHAQGLIHRDIKPANILLEKGTDRVKITDFGMARAAADASVTRTGVVTGTPQYMAPEQARGRPVDARTDLFSLGSVLYAMCTGRPPFRAQGSLAILKRVCEEAPSPIRESNPEIPEWLVTIIAKLQAKDPAERYQSATEVSEVLNGHLAQLIHPSSSPRLTPSPLPGAGERGRGEAVSAAGKAPDTAIATRNAATGLQPPLGKRRRWRLAAACILLLVGGFCLEAAGVTDLRGTVLRIITPDGILVVEADDPGLKVTVEGDGGVVINGAGLQEIRLRPGSYRVQADKNGKSVPLEKDWVSIATGGRQVLKVKLEAVAAVTPAPLPKPVTPAPPTATLAKAATGPFVLLATGKDYATLAEAVQNADDRETIEVRGNGPFVSEPININKAMVIRAGANFRPVIKASPEGIQSDKPLIHTNASLVLEGLELHRPPPDDPKITSGRQVVQTYQASLWAANCRFRGPVWMNHSPVCVMRNCEVLADMGHISGWYRPGARLLFENCLHRTTKGSALGLDYGSADNHDVWIQIKRGTFVSNHPLRLPLRSRLPDSEAAAKPLHVDVSESIFDCQAVLGFAVEENYLKEAGPLAPGEAETTLARLLGWHGERNLFGGGSARVNWWPAPGAKHSSLGPKDLAGWKQFWKTAETGSLEEGVKFTGGDLRSRTGDALDQLTPEDFRLRPDSAGHKAAKDGKDLGADVDLVGPGPAYERWKKTSGYQLWLKETGQNSTKALEAKAFVLLTGKGIEVKRYDTLADAVQSASDGDTIEVRGNGPFVTKPIAIQNVALTIRAGDGFWPVIKADPEEQGKYLLNSRACLVLEGLEFQWVDAKPFGAGQEGLKLIASGGPKSRLQAANCRFIMNRREGPHDGMACLNAWDTPLCHLRNCQFLVGGHGTVLGNPLGIRGTPDSELVIENCLNFGRGSRVELTHGEAMNAVLKRNTLLGPNFHTLTLALCNKIDLPKDDHRPFQIESSANIIAGPIQFSQFSKDVERLSASEAEQFLKRSIGWRENRNVYLLPDDAELLRLMVSPSPGEFTALPLTVSTKTVDDWNTFWSMKETGSQRGVAHFLGGDLIEKAKQTPEQLLPGDFRLPPGSAGYRAGEDRTDLGADVDLVGPGPAYERWKKTPEYEQWLNSTGQITVEATKPKPKSIVLLGAKGKEVGKYDTLAEAVERAANGDTIEVRSNGTFISDPIKIDNRALVIRAGQHFRPIIRLSPEGAQENAPLLTTTGDLVLEGLELQRDSVLKTPANLLHFVLSSNARLHVANCRFLVPKVSCVWAVDSPRCVVRNCEFLGVDSVALGGRHPPEGGPWIMDNCVSATGTTLYYFYQHQNFQDASIQLSRNTSLAHLIGVRLYLTTVPTFAEGGPAVKPSRLEVSDSLLNADKVVRFNQGQTPALPPPEVETLVARMLDWQGRSNVYGDNLLEWCVAGKLTPARGPKSLAEWKDFWKSSETDSLQGRARFKGGDLLARVATAPEKITPEDFRLRPDSPGHRAAKDGKDLGADVDLVGPGSAYERWKRTPEYQQWLTQTGQALTPSP